MPSSRYPSGPRRRRRADARRGCVGSRHTGAHPQPSRRRARRRAPARHHGLLEAGSGSRRSLRLRDAAEPLRPGPCRRARDRAGSAPARAPRRQGLLERVLPHPRDRATRIRSRDRQPGAPQHDRGRARRRLARADPRRTTALRDEARRREARPSSSPTASSCRRRRGRRSRKARRSSSGRSATAAFASSAA